MYPNVATLERVLHRHRFALLWAGFAAICIVAFVLNWIKHEAGASPKYAVGDLLLNYAGGMSRRGLLGQIALFFEDHFGGLIWLWAWALGCLLTAVLFVFVLRIFRALPDDPVYLPLILAPWGLMMFAYDEGASLRKEMLAYLALALILQALTAPNARRALAWVVAGSVVFLAALFAHEIVAMTAPAQVLAVLLVAQHWPELRRVLIALCVGVAVLAAGVVIYLLRLPIPDIEAICAAARLGCFAAAQWLGASTAENIAYTFSERGWGDVVVHLCLIALCALPMLGFRAVALSRGQQISAVCVVILFIMPLFVVAADWGRWVQMALYPLCLIALAGVPGGYVSYRRILPIWAAVLYVASWNLMHAHFGIGFRAVLILPALAGIVLLHWLWSRRRA